jgi:hypothetical protein
VFCRRFLVIAWLGALLYFWQVPVFGQSNPITADQIVANYVLAIGGSDRIASITTFAEKGHLSGNLTSFGQPFAPPNMVKEKGTFEFYFKAPNLRSYQLHRENNTVVTMRGCDGAIAWYIGADAARREFKPKPGSEYECKKGYDPMPLGVRTPNVRLQLKGKKKVGDRMAWAIHAQDPKSASTDIYYFDTETYLLLRWETVGSLILSSQGPVFRTDRQYSDYRDVGGIKLAFMVVQRGEKSSLVTILQEVEINAPIDNARFQEPEVLGAPQNPHVLLNNPSKSPEVQTENPPSTPPTKNEPPPAVALPETHVAADSTSLVTANFVSSSVAELQQIAPELRGLKAAENQQALPTLLDKIGARTLDLSGKIPNLISNEEIVESQTGAKATRESFSYLILARRNPNAVTLEEFRVDLKSGAMLETDDAWKPGAPIVPASSSSWDDLARASQRINARATGGPPLSQGFASMWVRFYPSNRSESTFRYLGQQEMDGHHTLVLAFAQKPGSVRLPAEVRFEDKSVPMYYQGFAWVDIVDFRIVRLRTDLLSPATGLPLTQLTAEVKFADTQATGFASPLWLPREVVVTSQLNGHTFHDKHSYSHYRSFQVRAKLLLNP